MRGALAADARLAVQAVFGWVLLGLGIGLPGLLDAAATTRWALAGTAAVVALARARARGIASILTVALATAALLLTSAAVLTSARSPALLVDAAHDGRFVTVTASLDAQTGATPIPITISSATVGASELTGTSIPALLFGEPPPAGIGAVIRASGTIVPGEAGERVRFLVFARGSPRIVAGPPWYLDWANGLRAGFASAADRLPGDGGALLPGLAIGDTSAVDRTLDAAMKSTSLSHLTAVSGANCAVVVGLVMLVGAAAGLSRRTRIALSLLVLTAFVILVTPSASVLRAAVMAALVLGSLARGRPARGLPILSLAVVVLLAVDPWLSRDIGFVLSVLATAGLLLLAPPLAELLARRLPAPLALVISVPLAAQLACQPVLILLDPAIPVYGVLANLLSEPTAPAATVLGLLGCIALPLAEPVGRVLTAIAWLPSAWIAAVARFFAAAPGARAPWLPGLLGTVALALVTALVLRVLLRPGARSSRMLSGALAISLVAYLGGVVGAGIGHRASIPSDWQIAACDIGQGDAVLVRSQGVVALIDTGPDPAPLAHCLDELGIGRIQLLILSHYDLDHVGGTAAVLGRVDHAIVGPVSDAGDTALRTSLASSGATVDEASRGDSGILGDLRWSVLWPPERLGTVEPGNAASVTVRFEGVGACAGGCLSSIFLGDLGEESQCPMLGVAHPAPVDVVKVAHHGSADQCERLYERLRARVGVISVGAGNRYGHPTDRLLDILERVGTTIARTDLEGMVLLSPAPDGGVAVRTERPPDRDVGAH
jgi:competence protein ComEC